MTLVVQKYGGTSVGSLEHIRRVARHVAATVQGGSRVIVTISAMGEQTDDLLDMAKALNPKPPRRELDMLLTAGERISAALLAIALDEQKIPAVSLTGSQCGILTDETHGNARITRILGDRIRTGLSEGRVVIVAGFQGMSLRTKEITTLGRGGTDLSAVALAAALRADVCELYKDVDGVYTADPRVVPKARVLSELSFGAMNALAWGGASVLHPRGAHLAAKFNIPFEIRSSLAFDRRGTRIHQLVGSSTVESPQIEALAHKSGMSLVSCRIGASQGAASIGKALDWLWQQGESPLISRQETDELGSYQLTQIVKTALVDDYLAMLKQSALAAGASYDTLRRQTGLAVISVVGQGFQQSPETVQRICATLKTPMRLVDTRNNAVIICVDESQLEASLNALHQTLLEEPGRGTNWRQEGV